MVNKSGDQYSLPLNEETGLLGVSRTVVRATAGGYLISTARWWLAFRTWQVDYVGVSCRCELGFFSDTGRSLCPMSLIFLPHKSESDMYLLGAIVGIS